MNKTTANGQQPTAPSQEPQRPARIWRKPRRLTVRLVLCVLVAGLLGAGVRLYIKSLAHESTDDATIEAHAVPISARVAGHVAKVLVLDNQQVRAGEVLVTIDPRDFKAALDAATANQAASQAAVSEAEAEVCAGQSRLKQAQADLASQHDTLGQAKADVAQAQAGFTRDAADLTRIRSLVQSKAVSLQDFDHAKATSTISEAKVNSSKRQMDTQTDKIAQYEAAIKVAEDTLTQARAQVEARKADLEKAKAETEQARLNLSYTRILAPCDGYVTCKSVESGAYVQVGQGLFSLVRPDVWVVANFKETQLTHMRPGQPVAIDVDVYPDVTFHGHVDSIQRGTGSRFSLLPPENATGNFVKVTQRVPVKIVFDQDAAMSQYVLAPGMSTVPVVDVSAKGNGKAWQTSAKLAPIEETGQQRAEASIPAPVAR